MHAHIHYPKPFHVYENIIIFIYTYSSPGDTTMKLIIMCRYSRKFELNIYENSLIHTLNNTNKASLSSGQVVRRYNF